jgi:hypothetical protein
MLNPDETVILVGQHGDTRILLGFHPEPGTYRAYLPPGADVIEGTVWEFSCPLCHASLVTDVAPELCALDMLTSCKRLRVYFSRMAGEQATFVVSAEGLVERYGHDLQRHSLDIFEHV